MKYVLCKRPSIDMLTFGIPTVQVLCDKDGGVPLLFDSEDDAKMYFADHAGGRSMDELRAFVREADAEDLRRNGEKV